MTTDGSLRERVDREQYRVLQKQLLRLPLINVAADLVVMWLLLRLGHRWAAAAWLVVFVVAQGWRWSLLRRQPGAVAPGELLRRLSRRTLVVAFARALPVPFVFAQPAFTEQMILTLVHAMLAAGSVVASGGRWVVFAVWSVFVNGGVALGWALQGTFEGALVATMIVVLTLTLTAFLREQERSLRQQIGVVRDNEILAASLRAERDRAEAAISAKSRFFAAANHDLRQPLHALSMNATALEVLARQQTDPRVRALSAGIRRALDQSHDLLDALLDLSRLDAGAVAVTPQAVALAPLLQAVKEEFAALATARGLRLEQQIDPATPPAVRADPTLLRRILHNLVSNAVKFTASGGVTLRAEAAPHGEVRLAVVDTGPGIDPAEQERVFEEFYQSGNPARSRDQGLGLGLAIVKRLAGLSGFRLQLHSQSGHGTRVELLLPGSTEDVSAPADATLPPVPAGARVLVVEDETEARESLQMLLEQLGCAVRAVESVAEADRVMDLGFLPQVLLVDLRLRDGDGLAVIDRVRRRVTQPRVLVLTGDTDPATLAQLAGRQLRVLHKPVTGPQLLAALSDSVT